MAVITLISTVSGVSGSIASSFSDMGVGTLTVSVSGSDLKTGMTPEDLETISELESVDGVVPSISLNGRVSYGSDVQSGISVSGRNAYYFILNEDMILQGRALNHIDDENSSYVCVISQEMSGTDVVAEEDGVVTSVSVETGSTVSKGDIIAQIAPISGMRVEASLSADERKSLKTGDKVTIELEADATRSYEGTVKYITEMSEEDTEEVTYKAVIDFSPDENVFFGMTVVVTSDAKTASAGTSE